MEKTFTILKPSTVLRGLIGEIISRFEKKGLILIGIKMVWLSDEILNKHYVHLQDEPFFRRIKDSMRVSPVIVCCWEGIEAVKVVRTMVGATNSRNALPGTIRGDYSMSVQENMVHASDSLESAKAEIKRFFDEKRELFVYSSTSFPNLHVRDEGLGDYGDYNEKTKN